MIKAASFSSINFLLFRPPMNNSHDLVNLGENSRYISGHYITSVKVQKTSEKINSSPFIMLPKSLKFLLFFSLLFEESVQLLFSLFFSVIYHRVRTYPRYRRRVKVSRVIKNVSLAARSMSRLNDCCRRGRNDFPAKRRRLCWLKVPAESLTALWRNGESPKATVSSSPTEDVLGRRRSAWVSGGDDAIGRRRRNRIAV